jgi:hypothetical protein
MELIKLFQPLEENFIDPLYLSSDSVVGVVKEKIKYMYPSDNGVFIKKIIENGIFSSFSSYVYKDNFVFGIRKDFNGNKEFWYNFDNNTKLSITSSIKENEEKKEEKKRRKKRRRKKRRK